MKNKLLLAALPLALACGSLAAQDVFELHGYARAGMGTTSDGGEQITFYLPNTGGAPTNGPGYRLGNETDNYIELAMDVRAYDKGSESFKLHFRPAFREYYDARDASADAGGNLDNAQNPSPNNMIYIREAYGEATGFLGNSDFLKDATIWAGRRFYQRQDLHLRDEWYWNDSGDGVGIENMNVGFAKLHYAMITHDNNNVQNVSGDWWSTIGQTANVRDPGSWWTGGTLGQAEILSQDIRLSDIPLWKNGSMNVGFQYNGVRYTAKAIAGGNSNGNGTAASGTGPANSGVEWFLEFNQSNFLGGDNRVFMTWGNGNTWYNWYNPSISTHDTWYQIMDAYYVKVMPKLDIAGVLIYRRQAAPVGDSNYGSQNTWESFGVRPTYYFTKHISLAYDFGYDQDKFDNEVAPRHLNKQTLALQFQPMANFWSRPSIRAFITKGSWTMASNNWGFVDQGGVFSEQGKTTGYTYGAQLEAWW